MKKLETKNDIIEWAKIIVEAKGEKFTPMSKGDLFAVASFILEKEGEESEKDENQNSERKDETTTESLGTAEDGTVDHDNSTEGCKAYEEQECEEFLFRGVSCTRANFFHDQRSSAQRVYDEFLKWCETNPQEANVMDFSNGTYNKGAAFAYWLQGRMQFRGKKSI